MGVNSYSRDCRAQLDDARGGARTLSSVEDETIFVSSLFFLALFCRELPSLFRWKEVFWVARVCE
jgi:hypothetical protein